MAFDYFSKEEVDIAIIETGLGGLLDSTNVISPILSIITNIGYDHTNILGNTLPEIAFQKAGIIKKETPVVIGELIPETKNVFVKKANEKEAPILFAQSRFFTEFIEPTGNLLFCNVKDNVTHTVEKLRLDLNGLYQAKNICTVLCAVDELKKQEYLIPESDLHYALENVKELTGMRGRWDIVQLHPTIILDVAHNTDGIRQVVLQLDNNYPGARLHFILGFVKDKDVSHVLELFPQDAKFYFTNAHIPRALPAQELLALATAKGLSGESFENVNEAIAVAKSNAGQQDVIMVCGSFFIISEID
jgi:dihydrofolate synthase/folylpolyglutamate synthase